MFCNKCGESLPDESQFCNYCGAQLLGGQGHESPARGASEQGVLEPRDVGDIEDEIVFRIRPTMLYVICWYILATAIFIGTVAFFGILSRSVTLLQETKPAYIVIAALGLILFAFPIYKHILRRREVYTLTRHKLEMRYGIIAKTIRNIPLRNVQDVTTSSSIWQRFLHLGDIKIDSASETGGVIILDDIHRPEYYAGMILDELRKKG